MDSRARVVVSITVAVAVAGLLPLLASQAGASTTAPTAVGTSSVRPVTGTTRAWRAAAPAAIVIGRSVQGRAILARRQGPASAPYVLLVLGQMHGSEPRGRDVVRQLLGLTPPGQLQVWTISTLNPDGSAHGRRTNAHGVDLNRNFPYRWSPARSSALYHPGRRPVSEPETRAMMVFLDQLRPDLLVSLHQAFHAVDLSSSKTRAWALRLATALHLRTVTVPCSGPCTGTMTSWYNQRYAGYAITVELPRVVTPAWANYDARAILRVARGLIAPPPAPSPTPTPDPTGTPSPSPTAP